VQQPVECCSLIGTLMSLEKKLGLNTNLHITHSTPNNRTMGFPRKVEVKGFKHATAGSGAASGAADGTTSAAGAVEAANCSTAASRRPHGKRPGGAVKASELVETLNSKCPLKWACSELYPATSSYVAAFGSNLTRTTQMHRVVFPEVNAGWGHVDEVRRVCAGWGVPGWLEREVTVQLLVGTDPCSWLPNDVMYGLLP